MLLLAAPARHRADDIELVRRALSHRSVSSTQIYARCGDERLREAVGA